MVVEGTNPVSATNRTSALKNILENSKGKLKVEDTSGISNPA